MKLIESPRWPHATHPSISSDYATAFSDHPHDPSRLFAAADICVEQRADGSQLLKSPVSLRPYARCVGEWLIAWARKAPERAFLAERLDGDTGKPWVKVSYANALARVEAIATWILSRRLGPQNPIVVLSDNSINHALLSLAAMHVGVPVASVSPAYSLMSRDHQKLKRIIDLLKPGAIYVTELPPYASALAAICDRHRGVIIADRADESNSSEGEILSFSEIEATRNSLCVARAFEAIGSGTVAKLLFTSGSTDEPKGVINTQRMLCASQEAKAQVWPFVEEVAPILVDWLPWSHTFGANHNFNLVLRNGGTLYIDAGKPVPGLFQKTLDNLRETEATIHFNVPRGFDMLVAELKKDESLRRRFFCNLQVLFYAAAALPQNTWNDLEELSLSALQRKVAIVSAWGSTETSPLATDCHFQSERSGVIGIPVPGVELKLLRNGDRQEIRVRGPNVTPGYWKRDDLTAKAFDEEGFYRIGDAVSFLDPRQPQKGLLFNGRVAEDFKLMSGTWVNVGAIRIKGIECLAPVAQDIVVTGHDRTEIGFLVFANMLACRRLAGLDASTPEAVVLAHKGVVEYLRAGLHRLKAEGGGSASYATRAILMGEPPSVDAGEITDKGYINQRAVLIRRQDLVRVMYEDFHTTSVIRL